MAAPVDNSQFGRLDNPVRAVGRSLPTHHPSDSPGSRHSFTPPAHAKDKDIAHFADDTDSDKDEAAPDWTQHYGGSQLGVESPVHDSRDEGTADSWVERRPSLIRLTGKHPFNSEPPLARLMQHGFVTPVPLHYVRNHGAVPEADWATWTIEITGLVRHPTRLTMDEIAREFAPAEMPITLVCSGNRRKEQNMVRQTVGFNWGPAAVSTSVWRGARLRDVLHLCGALEPSDGAHFVCFEGAENLPGGGGGSIYGTSLRREVAMDPSCDVMLAYMQNGERLTPDHGFPVRVIIPGFIGGRMVKWLKRIIVAPVESDSHYHFKDNRVLPCHVDAELADAEAWWYKPEYIINELNINSVITTPGHDETLPINAVTAQRPYTLNGYAYSGGGRKVTRVEMTLDGGETWLVCALEHPEKPNKYGKYWCWCFWSVAVELWQLLGAEAVAVRAWDESFNTQPEKLIWNVMGMMNNCWFRVKVTVRRPDNGELAIVFEHPTRPGNQPGGWMARPKCLESLEPPPPPTQTSTAAFVNTCFKQFTMSDISKHNSFESAWIVVHGVVYNCTSFLKDHPGGVDSILLSAGGDCTEEFDDIHSDRAKTLLRSFCIGKIIPSVESDVYSALSIPHEKTTPCTLVSKKAISYDVRLFRFALPSADQPLGLPVGKHVLLCATIGGMHCERPYSPTSPADEAGYFELLIKVYDAGVMSRHLDALPTGSALEVKTPFGEIEYAGRGNFLVNGKRRFARRLAMIAGGTGITPVYQVIQAVLRDPKDRTEMHLVYANRSDDNIPLREVLDGWEHEHPERFTAWYVVDEVRSGEAWRYSTGLVTDSVLRGHIPEGGNDDTLALACGPAAMVQLAVVPNLKKMGYDVANSLLLF